MRSRGGFIRNVRGLADGEDDQAGIAISLVQKIPYDYEKMYRCGWTCQGRTFVSGIPPRYPYQVLYDGRGVCGEKSSLLALLLKEFGFGVVLLEF